MISNKSCSFAKLLEERIKMATKRKKIVVYTISIEESEKMFPIKTEVTMPPLPEGHVARLASMRLIRTN